MVQGLIDGNFPPSPMLRHIPAQVRSCEDGMVEMTATVDPATAYNDIGIAHGGWAMTLLDTAMGLAAMTLLPAGQTCPSSDVSVRFFKGVRSEDEAMKIVGVVVSRGRRLIVAEGRIESRSGRIHARSSASFVIAEKREFTDATRDALQRQVQGAQAAHAFVETGPR